MGTATPPTPPTRPARSRTPSDVRGRARAAAALLLVALAGVAHAQQRLGRFVGVIDEAPGVRRVDFADDRTAYALLEGPLPVLRLRFESDDPDAMPSLVLLGFADAQAEAALPATFWKRRLARSDGLSPDGPAPTAVAIDADGARYQLLGDASVLERFDPATGQRASVGGWGAYPGLMAHPGGLAIAGGLVYVADTANHRVQVFDRRLSYIYEWGLHVVRPHEDGGHLHYPADVAVSPDGARAIVAEPEQDRLQVFGLLREGEPVAAESMFERETMAHYGARIARDGTLMITTEPDRPGVLVWDLTRPTQVLIGQLGAHGVDAGQFLRVTDAQLEIDGPRRLPRVWVLDAAAQRLQTFDLHWSPDKPLGFDPHLPRLVRAYALPIVLGDGARAAGGEQSEQRTDVRAFALVPGDGARARVVLHDAARRALVVADRGLRAQRVVDLGSQWSDDLLLAAVPGQDAVAVLDQQRGVLGVFTLTDGAMGRRVVLLDDEAAGHSGHGLERPILPVRFSGLAFEPGEAQRFWVSDERSHRLMRYDLALASRVGEPAIAPVRVLGLIDGAAPAHPRDRLGAGLFHKPAGLVFDQLGNLLVVDRGNHRVQCFDADGRFLDVFGARWFAEPARRAAVGRMPPVPAALIETPDREETP